MVQRVSSRGVRRVAAGFTEVSSRWSRWGWSRPAPPSVAVAEGLSAGIKDGDALARARLGQSTPTGDRQMQPRRVKKNGQKYQTVRQVYGRRWSATVYGGRQSVGVRTEYSRCTAGRTARIDVQQVRIRQGLAVDGQNSRCSLRSQQCTASVTDRSAVRHVQL